jgi:hypothetical protein
VSKRQQLRPAPPRKERWDRKQWMIAAVSVLIVLTMVLSALAVFFYNT